MENVREIILDTLLSLERDGGLSHQLIRSVLNKYDYLDARDKRYLKRVTEGTLERRLEIDHYLDHFSTVPVRKMKPLIRNLMRMSVYQLLYMDSVPDSAVCNEACKLAEKRKFHALKGFVNGVLRKIAREKNALPLPDREKDPVAWACVKYSMPELITRAWIDEYGQEVTERILEGLLEICPVSLRIPETCPESERKAIREELLAAGIQVEQSPYDEKVLLARDVLGVEELPGFAEGKLTVQDVSSVLAIKQAGIKEGDLVVDACGAPAGKSILASELAGETGKVICGDVAEKKMEIMRENVARMNGKNIEIRHWDARVAEADLIGKADVLLLDVPCSGLGVMGKKRDVKYHASEEGFRELEQLQKEILQEAWKYVKPGGTLLYSTCTVRKEENRDAVRWILKNLPFEPISVKESLPKAVNEAARAEKKALREPLEEWEDCCVQLLPGLSRSDGFFFARFRRKMDD